MGVSISHCYEISLMCCVIKHSWTLHLACIASLGVLLLPKVETIKTWLVHSTGLSGGAPRALHVDRIHPVQLLGMQ